MTTPKIKKVDYKKFGRDLRQRARERNAAAQTSIFSIEPVDRERMSNNVLAIYAALEKPEPAIFWCDSPFQTFAIPYLMDRFADQQDSQPEFVQFWEQCEEQCLRYLPVSLLDRINLGNLQNRLSKHFPVGQGYAPHSKPVGMFDRLCSRAFKLLDELGFHWQFRFAQGPDQQTAETCLLSTRQLFRDLNAPIAVQELLAAAAAHRPYLDSSDAFAVERAVATHRLMSYLPTRPWR